MPVHVTTGGKAGSALSAAFVRKIAAKMLATLQLPEAELSILLTGDDQIHILNRDYRHKDRPTDVLAFAMREGERGELAGDVLGDVVISLETAERQARAQGHSLREEAVFLLGHGLLHLLGWDHETKAKDRAMRIETERLCAAAGVPAPKAAGKSAPSKRKQASRKSRSAPKKMPKSRRARARRPTGSARRKCV